MKLYFSKSSKELVVGKNRLGFMFNGNCWEFKYSVDWFYENSMKWRMFWRSYWITEYSTRQTAGRNDGS